MGACNPSPLWIELVWIDRDVEHIERHGVTKGEVENVLRGRHYTRRAGDRILMVGESGGRTLFVVSEHIIPNSRFARVVTARTATLSEKRLLERRGKGSR